MKPTYRAYPKPKPQEQKDREARELRLEILKEQRQAMNRGTK